MFNEHLVFSVLFLSIQSPDLYSGRGDNDEDYLSVYDGPNLNSRQLSRLTDWIWACCVSIASKSNKMLVNFVTNKEWTDEGFRAKFSYIPIDDLCNLWFDASSGFLTSPEFPTTNCSWVITSSSMTTTISMHFEKFEVG